MPGGIDLTGALVRRGHGVRPYPEEAPWDERHLVHAGRKGRGTPGSQPKIKRLVPRDLTLGPSTDQVVGNGDGIRHLQTRVLML